MTPLRRTLVLSVSLALGAAYLMPAHAQSAAQRAEQRRAAKQKAAPEVEESFPNATRQAPKERASQKGVKELQTLSELSAEGKSAEVVAKAVPFAESTSNAYEKAFAFLMAGSAAVDVDDLARAVQLYQAAVDANGLDNNNHFNAMYNLAVVQSQLEQYDAALATLDRFLAETRSDDPKYLGVKANFVSAAGRHAEAAKLFEELLAKNPGDKRILMNAVAALQHADKFPEANRLLLDAQKKGQLTEAREYRALYAGLLNEDDRWKDAAAVIEEGVTRSVLPKDEELGKAYSIIANQAFFADDLEAAGKFYALAGPLMADGEAWLNLAKVYNNQGKKAEQRTAAQQALAKGVRNTAEAQRLANPK